MGTTEELLREGYVILRKVKFLQGDVYHILGQTSADEDVAYVVEWHFLDWRQWLLVVCSVRATCSIYSTESDSEPRFQLCYLI